jgi:hypothetical protein
LTCCIVSFWMHGEVILRKGLMSSGKFISKYDVKEGVPSRPVRSGWCPLCIYVGG